MCKFLQVEEELLELQQILKELVFKGVSTDYDWSFFKEYLVEGVIPNFDLPRNREILISKTIAR